MTPKITDLVTRLRKGATYLRGIHTQALWNVVGNADDCEEAADAIERLQTLLGRVLEDGWRDQDIPHVMKRRGIAPKDVRFEHYSPTDVQAAQPGSMVVLHYCRCGAIASATGINGYVSLQGSAGWFFSVETGWLCPKCAPADPRPAPP